MKQCKHIIVIVEGVEEDPHDHPAIAQGIELVRQNQGKLTLMDIIDTPDIMVKDYDGMFNPSELFEMFVTQRTDALENAAAQLRKEGFDVDVKVASGRAFIEIIRQVIRGGHDLVIKVANDKDGSFGGDDFHLMRKCPKPVWLLRSNLRPRSGQLLAAIDLSMEDNDEGRALNRQIMGLATALSTLQNARLHVLSCWMLYGESALRHSGFLRLSDDKLTEVLAQEQRQNQIIQDRLLDEFSEFDCQSHLLKGEADTQIPEFVTNVDIDCVVMGTVGRTGIPGLFIGNTAESILQCIEASVITVKPDGFETPVQ